MLRSILALVPGLLLATLVAAQSGTPTIAIIPEPVSLSRQEGSFVLPSVLKTHIPSGGLQQAVQEMSLRLDRAAGIPLQTVASASEAQLRFVLNTHQDPELGTEGYRLQVTPQFIQVQSNTPAGAFYAVQTLLQLFPAEIESLRRAEGVRWEIPAVTVTDYPRFGWRGLMFDVSRHFFGKEDVKKYIDEMVRYKYNLLHLHLTDDEGWRIQIRSYPKLTEVGAWNVKKVGYFGTFSPPTPDEPKDYGGFYTQDDIRELVAYAKARFVDIMPEIDVPGHSLATIASYPELSCTPDAKNYRVRSGEPIMNWYSGGFTAMVDNTLCPANEKVYEFLDKVIGEVAELFPFPYIHMGGDECAKNFWEKSDAIKALMKKEKLKTMEEVQSYFTRRVQKIVTSKGKQMIGWDEILEGGLAEGALVMSWRGMKGGIEAAKEKHEVVMSPTTYAYIDYMQGDALVEPRIYASLRLNKTYEFEPVPDGVDPRYIKGAQANLWTEQVYNMRHAEYMTWPRGMSIAETAWSPKSKKNWNHFFSRVEQHFERLRQRDVKFAPSVYDPIFTVTETADKKMKIELSHEVEGLDIYYTFDNSFPDQHYPKYTGALVPPKDAVMLKLVTYKGDKQVGRLIYAPLDELKKRIKK